MIKKFSSFLEEQVKKVDERIASEKLRFSKIESDHLKLISKLQDSIKTIKLTMTPLDEYFEIFDSMITLTRCDTSTALLIVKDMTDNKIRPIDITNFLNYLSSDFGIGKYQYFKYLLDRYLLINEGITHPMISSIIPLSPPSNFKASVNLLTRKNNLKD